jgi:phospholipid/cholesterol/gamma-HCH transport system substrate-binding protein
MQKRAPTFAQLFAVAAFALSCFGLLLFIWISFGGPTPLRAKQYEVKVPVTEAAQLATQSDVRISGVSVGKVSAIELGEGNRAIATVELETRYAPLPEDTRAILRQKTLQGETYLELTPGTRDAPTLPEGSTLPAAQVSDAVQLDEVLRTFDPQTREAFQRWMQEGAVALRGRGVDLSAAIGQLEPTLSDGNRVLRILDRQRLAVRELIRSGGAVFAALSERRGQLRGLIVNAEAVFSTTARRDRELQRTFTALPTFLEESRLTLARLGRFAEETDPLVQQLRPAARELAPVVARTGRLAPELERFFVGLLPAADAAPRGFPALRRLLRVDLPPFLDRLPPFLRELNPLLRAVDLYKHEVTGFLGNVAAATNARTVTAESGRPLNYLRTVAPFGPDSLAAYPSRLKVNRVNPYVEPLGYLELPGGLQSFQTGHCAAGLTATLDPADAAAFPGDLFDRLKKFAFGDVLSSDATPAPPCTKQEPFEPIGQAGTPTDYLHVLRQP